MTLASWAKKEIIRFKIDKSKRLLLPQSRLGSVESMVMTPVKEVVLAADLRCTKCQKRVADVISKMDDMESIVVHVLEKKVTFTGTSVDGGLLPKKVSPAVYSNLSDKLSRILQFSSKT